jgi:restriction endonuclease S subunit
LEQISTVGTIGNCAVVTDDILPANSDRHVGIIRLNNAFSPYFLSTFLISKYGRLQTIRESTGNVQLNLFIIKIKDLKIPLLSQSFQQKIELLVKTAHAKLEQSKQLYNQTEQTLLNELNLNNFQPSKKILQLKA